MADPIVSLLSSCMVKPSTPTIPHHMFLAAVDIMFRASQYARHVLFFKLPAEYNWNSGSCTHHLKRSLALALVEYFPLAGRLLEQPDGRLALDCNDAGVSFIEASIDTPFSCSLGQQYRPFFEQLAPHRDLAEWPPDLPLLSVQVTRFAGDEGVAIGFSSSHVAGDGKSFWHFMKSWGECGRGVPISLRPVHMREALHPDKLILPAAVVGGDGGGAALKSLTQGGSCPAGPRDQLGQLVQREFHFSEGMMKKLKHMAAASASAEAAPAGRAEAMVTSLQALNAHIWKHVTAARCIDKSRKTALFVLMDARTRCVPPLPDGYFGNAVFADPAIAAAQELEEESLGKTAMRIMEKIRSVGDTDVKTFYGNLEVLEQSRSREGFDWSMPRIHVGNSPRFPAYEVDFGWGSPVSVQCLQLHGDGDVFLFPVPGGGGSVAVCLALSRTAMEALEQDESFMSF